MEPITQVIVVGGSFAGTATARTRVCRLPAGHRLALVCGERSTTFNPQLPETAVARRWIRTTAWQNRR